MTNASHVAGHFADAEETMRLKFRGWERDLPHPGEKGGVRERRVRVFLRSILPNKYGIGTGHVIDRTGQHSSQTDIVIYDAQNGIAIPVDDYYSLYPCECVFAVIEVKSTLDFSHGAGGPAGTVHECLQSTALVKQLDRATASLEPIHSIVFAYTTSWQSSAAALKVKESFEWEGKNHGRALPEMVLVLDPGFVWGTSGPSGYNELAEFTNLYDQHPLLYFTSDLLHRLSETKVEAPNLWHEYIDWQPGQVMARIWERDPQPRHRE